MWGNVIGLAYSGLQSKLTGKPLKGSCAPRDIAMIVFSVLSLPIAMLQALFSNLVRLPLLGGTGKLGARRSGK